MIDNQRFRQMVEYLKKSRHIRNQQDFTERVGSDKATISQVMNNRIAVPKVLYFSIAEAFPFISIEWLKNGDGEMLQSHYTQNVTSGENFSQTGNVTVLAPATLNKAFEEIAAQRKLTEQALERLSVSQQQITVCQQQITELIQRVTNN